MQLVGLFRCPDCTGESAPNEKISASTVSCIKNTLIFLEAQAAILSGSMTFAARCEHFVRRNRFSMQTGRCFFHSDDNDGDEEPPRLGLQVRRLGWTLPAVLIARAFVGLGEGASMPAMNNLMATRVPPQQRASAIGTAFTGFHSGTSLPLHLLSGLWSFILFLLQMVWLDSSSPASSLLAWPA